MSDWNEDGPLDRAAETAARLVRAAGQAEKTAHSIQAAHAAAGAAKTGASTSGAAAGTALGGPMGLVIGALATSKTFWKVIGAIFLFLLLFLFLIVNSVGIIMSYLGFGDAGSYVSQAREAERQNMQTQIEALFASDPAIKQEICALIETQRDLALSGIDEDFSDHWEDYDEYEVVDECEDILLPGLSKYLSVLMEETWSGSQITGFNGYGVGAGDASSLTSPYDAYFSLAAATYQVPEALLKAMGKAESDYDSNAVSSAGAIGIMQLMPSTAANLGVSNPYDPKQNIMGGAKYLAELLRTFSAYPNGTSLAVAAYNAGPGAVKRSGYQIPQNGETPAYVTKVMGYLSLPGGGGTGEEGAGTIMEGTEVSKVLLKALVEEKAPDFLGWTQTGTHTETDGSGDDEEEIEIVDYTIVVKLSPQLSILEGEHSFKYVTDQTTFNYVLKLFELLQNGKEGVGDLLFKAASWKNYILGTGASEDIYTSDIETGGESVSYDTVEGCVEEVVYYNQGEEPWASVSYGSSTIRSAGCGPTALAIVISTLTGERVTPEMTAQYAVSHGEYVSGQGTSHSFPGHAAQNWGLTVERVKREEIDRVADSLKKGKLAVVICAENTISKSGHYIVLTGMTGDGYFTIADPGSRNRTGNVYSPSTIRSYARNLGDGSIWIIGE